ncbi:MAG: hypothetical protein NTZ51_11675, partial [Proteobacteria bacterium]|nr:hypothetical protein [Pseudomonadota bacterium]
MLIINNLNYNSMTQLKPFSGFEAQMSGAFGDFYIGHAAAVTTKKFSHIVVGESGATLTDVKIRGVSVKAARAYPNVMPAGYPMCAGGNDYFDSIELSAGDAQGFFFEEPVTPVASA